MLIRNGSIYIFILSTVLYTFGPMWTQDNFHLLLLKSRQTDWRIQISLSASHILARMLHPPMSGHAGMAHSGVGTPRTATQLPLSSGVGLYLLWIYCVLWRFAHVKSLHHHRLQYLCKKTKNILYCVHPTEITLKAKISKYTTTCIRLRISLALPRH